MTDPDAFPMKSLEERLMARKYFPSNIFLFEFEYCIEFSCYGVSMGMLFKSILGSLPAGDTLFHKQQVY